MLHESDLELNVLLQIGKVRTKIYLKDSRLYPIKKSMLNLYWAKKYLIACNDSVRFPGEGRNVGSRSAYHRELEDERFFSISTLSQMPALLQRNPTVVPDNDMV